MFMTMFRQNDNTNISSDTYACSISDLNTANLYWYTVNDCYGYEIKWAIQNYVANGESAWLETEQNGLLSGDTVIVGSEAYNMTIQHLSYQTDYRFAIRVLHSADKNDSQNSKWYGYGGGRDWQDYFGMQTGARYDVPTVIQVSDITKTSMRVNLNRSIAGSLYTDDQRASFRDGGHFEFIDAEKNTLKVDYLTFSASLSSPNATVPAQYAKYTLTDEDWQRGYIDIDGLSENSVYNIDVWNGDQPIKVDACYNSMMKRTKGDPLPPILIKHVTTAVDTVSDVAYDISQYQSMKLDNIFTNYLESNAYAENQVFYLEGGKAYHFISNPNLYKGVTFQTNPADVAKGLRATLYMGGITKTGTAVNAANFMLGRQPRSGENSTIALDIDSIRFIDLDVSCPQAVNYGQVLDGVGVVNGNYFMNMYSNGMGINVTYLEWKNCTFQNLIRGFFRIQGSNDFNIREMKLTDCEFYNCGYYAANGGDYAYIFADHNGKPKSNILENVEISGNVLYDCPKSPLVTDNARNVTWNENIRWNVNIHHNTFVNFNTVGAQEIVKLRYIPGGSKIQFRDNLIILTKDERDVNRTMNSAGFYTQKIQGGDGTGLATFIIGNNYSTNDNLTNGQVFATNAMSATTSYAVGKIYQTWEKDEAIDVNTYFPMGKDALVVTADDIKATELMVSPNPKNFVGAVLSGKDHHTDNGINGLYYQQTDKVFNSAIYKAKVGAPRLFNGK